MSRPDRGSRVMQARAALDERQGVRDLLIAVEPPDRAPGDAIAPALRLDTLRGAVTQPTIRTGAEPSAAVFTVATGLVEVLGPVVTVQRADSADDAIRPRRSRCERFRLVDVVR